MIIVLRKPARVQYKDDKEKKDYKDGVSPFMFMDQVTRVDPSGEEIQV